MKLSIESCPLPDVMLVRYEGFRDVRGFFQEVFNENDLQDAGLPLKVVQMNHIGSIFHTIRGLHFQWGPPMGKLMRVIRGRALLVTLDIRHDSKTLGKFVAHEIDETERVQIWAPAGFARGFCALSDYTEVQYFCTACYNGANEGAILWNDPDLGIKWPAVAPVLSEKDKSAVRLKDWLKKPEAKFLCMNQKL